MFFKNLTCIKVISGPTAALMIVTCAFGGTAGGQSGLDQSATTLIETTCRNSVSGAIADGKGTGFVIERSGYVLTASHVVNCPDDKDNKQWERLKIAIQFGSPLEGVSSLAQLIAVDKQADIALLKIGGAPRAYKALRMCVLRAPLPETNFVGAGFPEGRGYQPVNVIFGNEEGESGKWAVAAPFSRGMSGGPVAYGGYVVGVIVGGFKDIEAARIVSPIYKAAALIEKEVGVLVPSCEGADKRTSDGRCRVMGNHISEPIKASEGDCFASKDGKSRGVVRAILSDAMRFTDVGGKLWTCTPGIACSFGWDEAPRFSVIFDERDPRHVEIVGFRN